MFSIDSLTHGYGDHILFKDLSWQVKGGERCALVGPNGAGKTTILRILAGELCATAGTVSTPRNARIGYLPQEGVSLHAAHRVLDEAVDALGPIRDVAAQIDAVQHELEAAAAELHDQLAEKLGALQHRYEELDGYRAEAEAARVLAGLGFGQKQMQGAIGELSGGWQMRVALAKLVLARPEVLLLDEPTNHLDIESVRWLETELLSFPGAVVLVTHDRYLLERLATRVVELQGRKLEDYPMHYRRYLEERVRRREAYEKTRLERVRKVEELDAWIDRFRYKATKARQVQSRIKMREAIELPPSLERDTRVRFSFAAPPRSGRIMLEAVALGHAYGSNQVLSGLDFQVERGSRIGIVGANGVGKSTLLRLIGGQEKPTRGEVRLGTMTIPAFLAQDQSQVLDPGRTVLEEIEADAETAAGVNLRTLLGAFLFSGDDIDKKVSVLSGGEKGRLGLAKLLLKKANLLLLDEPTNHLDMASRDVLVAALKQFEGTVLLVSHDRSVLDRVCSKTLYLRDGQATLYPGTWSEFEAWAAAQEVAAAEIQAASPSANKRRGSAPAPPQTAADARGETKQSSARRRKAERRLVQLEERLRKKEQRAEQLGAFLSDPELYQSPNGARYTREYQDLQAEIEMLYGEWEGIATSLEE
jgi:ATP-binding cassette subfamily F protein 3